MTERASFADLDPQRLFDWLVRYTNRDGAIRKIKYFLGRQLNPTS